MANIKDIHIEGEYHDIEDRAGRGMIATIEESSTASKTYAIGEYLIYNNKLYTATAVISKNATIIPGTNASEVLVTSEFNKNYRTRQDITSKLANLSTAVAVQNLERYGYKIGDYFTGPSEYTYVIADYNTFKGTSTPYCITDNHLGIVVIPHTTSKWHTEDVSSVGYNGSTLHSFLKGTVMDTIKADMIALFGGSTGLEHLFSHSKLLTTALANWAWQSNQYISALTCTQIDAGSQWTANGFQEGEASKSLEVFRKYKWTEIFGGEYPWLRNISNYNAGAYACYAGNRGALSGDDGVTSGYCVVGLIIFH